jgi:hypothetical protein
MAQFAAQPQVFAPGVQQPVLPPVKLGAAVQPVLGPGPEAAGPPLVPSGPAYIPPQPLAAKYAMPVAQPPVGQQNVNSGPPSMAQLTSGDFNLSIVNTSTFWLFAILAFLFFVVIVIFVAINPGPTNVSWTINRGVFVVIETIAILLVAICGYRAYNATQGYWKMCVVPAFLILLFLLLLWVVSYYIYKDGRYAIVFASAFMVLTFALIIFSWYLDWVTFFLMILLFVWGVLLLGWAISLQSSNKNCHTPKPGAPAPTR